MKDKFTKKLYMIGNTHFDPVWLWKWDEAMASIRATFRSALDRMKEDKNFCYSFSSPLVFEWIKKTDSELFEEIKERVKEGRWDLAEGWWDQPDCYTASGESYIRQGLYGQRYLKENFGKYSECVFNTDSFGHPNMFPQILAKSGIKYYCLCRPEERHCDLESPLFKWKSCDGSEVTAFRIGGKAGEGWGKDTAEVMQGVEQAWDLPCDDMIVFGVTDHGGAPTKEAIAAINADDNAVFSTVKGYFEAQENIPAEYEGEFITGDFGVYCNKVSVKKMNRIAEYALLNAEKASFIADENNSKVLAECWKDVMFNQFHDILGGASVKDAYTDARNLHGRAIQTAEEIMHFSLQRVTSKIKMPGKNPDNVWNIVLWNLNGCEYNGYVEAEVQWAHKFDWYDGEITLEDESGNKTACQIITEMSVIPRFRSRFIFKASVPSVGYKCYKVIRDGKSEKKDTKHNKIETKYFIFEISENDGSVKSIFDKKSKTAIMKNMFVPACYEDDGDTWCFNIDGYGRELGHFKAVSSEIVENGTYIVKVKVTAKYNNSLLDIYYTFYNDEAYFDVNYVLNWNEAHTVLKFNNSINDREIKVSTPYGQMIREETLADQPMGEWIKTRDTVFIFDSNFAYNLHHGVLGLTVVRSPIYGDLRISDLPDKDYRIMEQGINEGNIRVVLDGSEKSPSCEASLFNNKPIVICESNHEGDLPYSQSYASLKADNALLTAIKHGEDDGTVFRVVDYSGKAQNTVLTVSGKEYLFELGANEIKTFKIDNGDIKEINMIEEDVCGYR